MSFPVPSFGLGYAGMANSASDAAARSIGVAYGILFVAGITMVVHLFFMYHQRPAYRHRAINRLLWRPWSWMDAAHITILITASLLAGSSIASGLDGLGWINLDGQPLALLLTNSLSLHGAAILVVFWLMRHRGLSWVTCFAHRRWTWSGGVGGGLVAYLAIIPFLFAYAIIYNLWLRTSGQQADMQEAIHIFSSLANNWERLGFILVAVGLAPVAEELLFRGILLPALGRLWGIGAAIGLSSLLFAFIHLHVPSFAPLLVLSVGLSFAYVYSQSLLVPIVMHMIFNAVSLATVSVMPF